jgi:uncharacterized membrane protein (UPF0127 family)
MTVFGCSDDSPRAIPTDIPFRPDGILEFRQPSSELVTRIVIEIAESDSAQARGLMNRRTLPARGGMIFVDRTSSDQSFWMRNTPLPLDIIFVRSDSTILNIVKKTVPYSDARIESTGKAQFVVEVRAGFTDRMGIKPGQRIHWWREEAAERE